ncbi:MAG: hypothetical protein LBM18_05445 [Oscillospiraceae bacterium]|jgi:hypothetical protein|nr:hypothetical protein [Oscillospiraceae bacterium]
MKNIVLYYSFTGHSREFAEAFAKEHGYEATEVTTPKKHGMAYAFIIGCPKSLSGGSVAIKPLALSLEDVDEVHVFAPVWAGCCAPAMNTALKQLPKGTKVYMHMVSSGGESNRSMIEGYLEHWGLNLAGFEDIKG